MGAPTVKHLWTFLSISTLTLTQRLLSVTTSKDKEAYRGSVFSTAHMTSFSSLVGTDIVLSCPSSLLLSPEL
ncbi:hypothetical protein B0H10DRAFT_2000581 [Mycena sp. CBHHK59/15]|nr:hypothetical protein B0H10DRAFT_2000581 [Mycena sp. CBHHK59/15]